MKTKIIIASVTVVSLSALGLLFNQKRVGASRLLSENQKVSSLVNGAKPTENSGSCAINSKLKNAYTYSMVVNSKLTIAGIGQPIDATQEFSGKLAIEALEKNASNELILLGQFVDMNKATIDAHGKQFESPFLVKLGDKCEITGFARLKSNKKSAAQVQQVAMHDLWFQMPTTTTSEVRFENGVGLASAVLTKNENMVTRQIKNYEMSWRVKQTFNVTQSLATATFDNNWLASLSSQEGISGGMVNSAVSTLRLQREDTPSVQVASASSRDISQYEWENLLSGNFTETQADVTAVPLSERRFVEATKNETLENTFAQLNERVNERVNIEEQWHEMAGFLNGHPEKIGEFAKGLREPEFPESMLGVSYLVLSKTVHPEARDVLLALRRDTSMGSADRVRASLALVTRKDVGVELAKELRQDALSGEPTRSGESEGDYYNKNAVMHLGVLANLHRSDLEVQNIAKETASEVLGRAGESLEMLTPALGAIGNLADMNLLSTVETYSQNQNPDVRALVPNALRSYKYAQTESLVASWLARETSPEVKQEIFNIVHHQLADAQRNAGEVIVAEAAKHLAQQPMVLSRQSLVHILGPVKNQYPVVRELLINQLAIEHRNKSGVYSQIAYYLLPEEITLGLSRMPEFAHQYDTVGKQRALEEANVATANDIRAHSPRPMKNGSAP